MIILDEQLLGRGVEIEVAKWYPGAVRFVTELRPGCVIKDEMIPLLLRRQSAPTFVTINETDFWRKTPADIRYCLVCAALPDSRVPELPALLRRLLRRPDFRAKAQRIGRVIRLTDAEALFYTADNAAVRALSDW